MTCKNYEKKTSLKQETFPALSIIKAQETLQKIISSDYNAIRYVYTFLSRYTTFTILLGKILIACNYGKLVKALKQSFILFIYLFWLTTNNLTLCWFSISLSCFVNDGLASGSFCQQFIMIWYLRKIISSLFVISPTNFSGIVRVAFFLTFLLFSSRTECQKVKNKWLFKLFKHIIKTSSLILVWYYLVTLSSLKLRNKIWLVLYTIVIFLKYIKTFTICHPRVVA